MMKRLLILLFMLSWGSVSAQQVSASFSKKSILIGEQIYLTLKANAKPGSIVWPVLKDTINQHIEILDSVITINEKNQSQLKRYLITSFDSGYYAIPPFQFKIDSQLVESDPLLLEVHTVAVDTTKDIKDIKEIALVNYSTADKIKGFFEWLLDYWFVWAPVLVALAIWLYWRRKNRKKPVEIAPVVVIPLHEQLLMELEVLDKKQLWQNNQTKQYYTELTDLIRTYLEKRYKVMAHEQTTVQLMSNLKSSGIKSEAQIMLKGILEMADMVKFAKAIPTPYENQGALDHAKQFAVLTREEPIVEHG